MLITPSQRHGFPRLCLPNQPLRQGCGFLVQAQQRQEQEDGAFCIQIARNSAELRSAASLRAITFCTASQHNRSQLAALSHQRMRAHEMWDYLETATALNISDEQADPKLVCFLATTADKQGNKLAVAARTVTDLSCSLPLEGGKANRIVIGTLDLTIGDTLSSLHRFFEVEAMQGPRLQGDSFAGSLPSAHMDSWRGRAYLSNVCVAAKARRMGVAAAMIMEAKLHACQMGVQHLYVHCDLDNPSAQQLYEHSGFRLEQYEDAAKARSLNRSRRILLHQAIGLDY